MKLVTGIALFLLSLLPAAGFAESGALQQQVESIAAQHHGKVALFAENLRTQQTIAINPDTPVQTASVIKLAILYEALRQVREGKVSFSDRMTLATKDQVPGSGLLLFFDTPLTVTFKDALTMMIVVSDNSATNLAIDHLGIDNINATVASLGLQHTYLYKKIFEPIPPGVTMPADQKKFGLGKTTAREMATLMTQLATCQLAEKAMPGDEQLCTTALRMLHLQFYREAIPRYLDGLPGATEDSIADKTGALEAVRNDVAAISSKEGLIVISAFTSDNADHSWGVDGEAEMTIAKMARAIVAAWSPGGLAPWPKAAGAR